MHTNHTHTDSPEKNLELPLPHNNQIVPLWGVRHTSGNMGAGLPWKEGGDDILTYGEKGALGKKKIESHYVRVLLNEVFVWPYKERSNKTHMMSCHFRT